MAGHSKWANIKRRKGAVDAARGKIFTKLAREVQVAARGGADMEANFALRLAVEKARAENMSKESIERAIRRGAGLEKDVEQIEEIVYEGYGPHGIAILVECLTDNRNRTTPEVRRCFTRVNGNLGEPGSVAWQFANKGYFLFNRMDDEGEATGVDPDAVFMVALEAGAEDVQVTDEAVEVYTERSDFARVSQAFAEAGLDPDEAQLTMVPNASIALSMEEATAVMNLIEALEELEDVNNVYHNLELTDEVVAQFA